MTERPVYKGVRYPAGIIVRFCADCMMEEETKAQHGGYRLLSKTRTYEAPKCDGCGVTAEGGPEDERLDRETQPVLKLDLVADDAGLPPRKNAESGGANLALVILDTLRRPGVPASSAGEVYRALKQLGICTSRPWVKQILDQAVRDGQLTSTERSFIRNGRAVRGRAYGTTQSCSIPAGRVPITGEKS